MRLKLGTSRFRQGMIRPGDEPLKNDAEVEIIDVPVCRQAGLNISLNGSPLSLVSASADLLRRMIRRGGKDLEGMYQKDMALSMSKYGKLIL